MLHLGNKDIKFRNIGVFIKLRIGRILDTVIQKDAEQKNEFVLKKCA